MNSRAFREYDIRGVADRDFPDDFVTDLGRAIGTMIRRNAESDRPTMAVGRDCRDTSPRIRNAFIAGIVATGCNVYDVGIVPTPALYFAPFHWDLDGAVIITGSHNPPQDNGFKILRGRTSIHGADITALRTAIETSDFDEGSGECSERDVLTPYLAHAASTVELGERRCKVVVDAGNGTGGPAAVRLYERLGFDVVPLYCEMDASFPNHHPDPTVEANLTDLRDRVKTEGAELGIAFDGDADRIGAIDGTGRILWGDQLMILFGRAILARSPGATFIGEVSTLR